MFRAALLSGLLVVASSAGAEPPPLLKTADAEAIASQISGGAAKRTVEAISLNHRMRGSEGYRRAAELIRSKLEEYGLAEANIIALPADGKIFYGTQRSRPAWDAEFAELWEQRPDDDRWVDAERIASLKDQPITLAQDSVSGSANAALVDVGEGRADSDYAGKNIHGKLVLTSSQPEEVAKLAVTKYGAAGIVSWAQNQKSAWWGEDENLIRWGHLDTWKVLRLAETVAHVFGREGVADDRRHRAISLRELRFLGRLAAGPQSRDQEKGSESPTRHPRPRRAHQ